MRDIDLVVVHCSATGPDQNIGVAEIRRWHKARGFADVGYHYVIRRDGHVEVGRPVEQIGAHVYGMNKTSIGVCLVGGVDADNKDKADCNFTLPQWNFLADVLNRLAEKWPDARLVGHRDLDPKKACPCFSVAAFWGGDTLRKRTA